jgi:hypothetical protein
MKKAIEADFFPPDLALSNQDRLLIERQGDDHVCAFATRA